jgi:5,10-methylenetetrahydrofolate reductase
MSPVAAGLCALREGVEPVIQVSCRDRNRIAIRSDVLGACALGLKNVVCLTGDHQSLGEHPSSKNVYDVDSIQLIGMLAGMRDGGSLAAGLKLLIGGHYNPCGYPLELRVIRLAKAAAAGADFILTTWIHDVERFMEYMRLIRDRGLHRQVKILAGIALPGVQGKTARNPRAGHSLSETYLNRLENAKDRMAEGVNIYIEQIRLVREIEGVAGIYIMADEPLEQIAEIMKGAGLLPRPESVRAP